MAEREFPGNSQRSKEESGEPRERPRLEKIVDGDVTLKKKSAWGGYLKGAIVFVGTTVVVPMLKDLITQGSSALIEGVVYGDDARNRSVGSRIKNDRTSYDRMYGRDRHVGPERTLSSKARATHDFGELTLNSRNEGIQILTTLGELIKEYGSATVSELYDLVGITGSFTDSKWGWYDLRGAEVRRGRGGFVLEMPKTEPIE